MKFMKNIAIIGASGFIGTRLLNEALNRGHKVTAIVRHPNRITRRDPNLTIKRGNILDAIELARAIEDVEIVISAYHPGWTNPEIYKETIEGYASIIEGTKKAGIKRILIVGGAGSLFVDGKQLLETGVLPEIIMPAVKSLAEVLESLQINEKELDWAFFSPAGSVVPGERTGVFRLGHNDLLVDSKGKSRISAEDYAMAMIDELENPQHHFERFTIAY